jgi:pimeloyl-ACP methyl ester carboxylesterase
MLPVAQVAPPDAASAPMHATWHIRRRNMGIATRAPIVAAVLPVIAACSDVQRSAIPTAPTDSSSFVVGASGLRDDQIDSRDTYFAYYVTTTRVSTEEPTGVALFEEGAPSYEAPWQSYYSESGYDGSGQFRFSIWFGTSQDPEVASPPSLMRTVGNTVYMYDQGGGLLLEEPFYGFLDGNGLPAGTLANATARGSTYYDYPPPDLPEPHMIVGATRRVVREGDEAFRIVTEARAEIPMGTSKASSEAPPSQRTTKRFVRHTVPAIDDAQIGVEKRDVWLLESIEQEEMNSGMVGPTHKTRSTIRYVAKHVNLGKDKKREKAIERQGTALAGIGTLPAPAADPSPVFADPAPDCYSMPATQSVNPGYPSVVYQHGFNSNKEVWCGMRLKVRESNWVGFEQAYSLNSLHEIRLQAEDLVSRIAGSGQSGNVIVAHSNGGLVSRKAAQMRPDLISAVITIGSPHEGALAARFTQQQLTEKIVAQLPCVGNWLCWLQEFLASTMVNNVLTASVSAGNDAVPGSPFLQTLNTTHEQFRRASIEVTVPNRWAFARIAGDMTNQPMDIITDPALNGGNWVNTADRAYKAAWLLRILTTWIRFQTNDFGLGWTCGGSGYIYYWRPCFDGSYASYFWRADHWDSVVSVIDILTWYAIRILDFADDGWRWATMGRAPGDGFIDQASQRYPSFAPGAHVRAFYTLPNIQHSHVGETSSISVHSVLAGTLDFMGVPRK